MLKLMKYELRKNRTLLLTILGIIAALEAYFLISARITAGYTLRGVFSDAATRAEINLAVSMGLLAAASFGTALAIFVMGVAGYSRELNQKTSYLIFMTPNNTMAIIASKLLFTLIAGVAFAALLVGLACVDFPIFSDAIGSEWRGYYNMLDMFMSSNDLSLTAALLTIAFYVGMVFLSIVSTVSVAFFAITLSATFMRGKKGHALVSVLLFAAISWGLSRITSRLTQENVYRMLDSALDMVRLLTPQACVDGAVIALSLVACAWMLKKRVDL